ncbi:MAG: preprotein translocase subunit YajC [Clostridia bacterium]|jgi:preprotein translocase subunit YajC|nr:preprotein translocase subunit YajC [Clostridia bacterium]MBQ5802506.1 preprotein translocase subunit YajC [Clostridia bacterium]
MFIWNLLADETNGNKNPMSFVFIGILLVLIVVYFVWSSKSMKKRDEARQKMIEESLRVGVDVLTIGGIYGTIVEVDADGSHFVIETGSETQKSYLKFDKVAFHSVVVKDEEVEETAETTEESTEN